MKLTIDISARIIGSAATARGYQTRILDPDVPFDITGGTPPSSIDNPESPADFLTGYLTTMLIDAAIESEVGVVEKAARVDVTAELKPAAVAVDPVDAEPTKEGK